MVDMGEPGWSNEDYFMIDIAEGIFDGYSNESNVVAQEGVIDVVALINWELNSAYIQLSKNKGRVITVLLFSLRFQSQ